MTSRGPRSPDVLVLSTGETHRRAEPERGPAVVPAAPALSVVVPVFNEADSVSTTLSELLVLLGQLEISFEVVVVDDGSTDGSAERATALGSPFVRLIQHPYNIGNGAAIKTGIRNAAGTRILLMDADGQHPVDAIPELLAQAQRFDMVVAARTRGSDTSFHRDLANTVYNRFGSYVCNLPIRDLTSGFRVIDAAIAKGFVYLLPNTFSYPTTLTLAVARAGHSLTYVPVKTRRRAGKSKIRLFADGVRFFTIILKIAVFFAPLRVFLPISSSFFAAGLLWYLYRVFVEHRPFPPVSSLLMISAVIIFMIGLVSEQITYLRFERY